MTEALRMSGVDPSLLELELTERIIMGDPDEAIEIVRGLNSLGIRLSLGARPAEILWGVVREGLRNSLLGAAVGTVGAWQLSGLLEDVLFGVERSDPVTLGGALVVIVASSLLACWVPARRASRVDPVVVLRGE
ncbi:MAG: FtsX-like permease family protein [Thermoanaerobaculia bacterium]|nr:FtsX-like permease family protein [Thermoanaerobaculia bacterium]